MIGFLYAGQGSQVVGMGKDIYDALPAAQTLWERWPNIKNVAFDGPQETLSETKNAQLALALFAMAVTDALQEAGIRPDMATGLSLGAYSALYAAGIYSEAALMRILTVRSAYMQAACQSHPGEMYAVLGSNRQVVSQVCAEVTAATGAMVALANDNTPKQQVIGGEAAAMAPLMAALTAAGARKVLPLAVSGAFHTPLMIDVQAPLATALAEETTAEPQCVVLSNVTAAPLVAGEIETDLVAQVVSPVRMVETLEAMAAAGVDTFVEIGPGRVLSGFVRQTLGKNQRILSIDTYDDLLNVINELGGLHAN